MSDPQLQTTVSEPPSPELPASYDVAIVGGGIVGATVACALKDSGLQVALIEPQPKTTVVNRNLAYALTLQTGRILDGIGVWGDILPKITTFRQISLSDSDHPGVVEFRPEDLGTEALGYVGEHSVILRAMHEFLDGCDNVRWLCPGKVHQVRHGDGRAEIEVEMEGEIHTIAARLVVAADGSKSPLRQAAGIKTHGWKYWQSCVAFTVETEKHHNNVAFERFWPTGPMGVLPLPGNRCQVVLTAPHAQAHELQAMDEAEFMKLLEYRTGGLLGRLKLLGDRAVFPVQLMQSDRYVGPRLALAGDAAHGCHPVGGQGLNMGVRDAAAIAEVVQTAHRAGEDIGDPQILKSYESWRQRENLMVLGLTDFLDRMFSGSGQPKVVVRRWGLWGLRKARSFRYLALRLMTGLMGRPPKIARSQ
jgi:2-octaprenyl-6-methoxyphenol hydroxylase